MFLSDKPKFFGRRKGRTIRKAKSTLLEAFLPTIKITPETNFNKQTLFVRPVEKVFLEIGFGNGEHLAGQALNNPETGFIGAEVFQNGVANLLTLITGIKEGDNLPEKITLLPGRNDNIRVWDDDVRLLFSKIPDNFVDKVFVLFPDPWPKKRHASRRFINPDNLKEIARILKKDGILRVATDHKVYKGWTLRQMAADKNFVWTAKCGNDWKHEPSDWVQTKYQRKAIREGRRPVFLDYKRV
ncbi:MAG: tRNA (guanosine(46)-N7)-methyltransferase TrmB [Alphaproteobacteria bacterium]|nr:tRNA (guanosine(46)-N7)-methyltransferase TrmB [Alphaproteobacteria bacterium]